MTTPTPESGASIEGQPGARAMWLLTSATVSSSGRFAIARLHAGKGLPEARVAGRARALAGGAPDLRLPDGIWLGIYSQAFPSAAGSAG